ncbi:DUF2974 domain-containing protein [Pseudomonas gingeri]|uniref:DUF2974 domain-containing protein n=1 Tax=Pseudomonas gingeri TaxID=117681 RepID=UPI0015A48D2C|nr:DUF2974 domain-containing protein [Pseudomonas gingeri]NWA09752.1 DUF2974 domain-containing protein [Pseudomonas gingeri]
MKIKKSHLLSTTLLFTALQGCSWLPINKGKLEGRYWCNDRYIDMVAEHQDPIGPKLKNKLNLAQRGYLYSTAAVLTLQKENSDPDFNFKKPDYLTEITSLTEDQSNGFQATTYIHKDPRTGTPLEAIIAFRGSDQIFKDYILHNFSPWPIQFKPARDYVKKVSRDPATKGLKLIVTGYSLGGGLAVHVTKNPETSNYISQAWAFNPSWRIGDVNENTDPRIFLMANKYEVLNAHDRSKIGAPASQTDTDYDLVRSSAIYGHYRWVLERDILIYADFADYVDSGRTAKTTQPSEILKTQAKNICAPETELEIQKERKAYNNNHVLIQESPEMHDTKF